MEKKKTNTKEAREFSKICQQSLNNSKASMNLLEFITDKENEKSASMLIWALTMSLAFLKNQTQDKWVFEEPTEDEAEIAQEIILKTIKSLHEYLNPHTEMKIKLEF